ncbi:MAG: flagellar hook protein [Rhodobacteraceae bacterium]|nr:flagellar hook protein [Paracoccaceae bacterium]
MSWTVGSISTYQFNLFNRQNVERSTRELQRAGQEVSTGRHYNIYTELGPRSASAIKLRAREMDTQTYQQSNSVLDTKLQAMLTSVNRLKDGVQNVLESALANATRPSNGANVLQTEARAALESLVAIMNTSYNGEHIFSGTRSDAPPLVRWDETNANTGLSPEDVMTGIVAGGPPDAATAAAMISEIDLVFSSTDTVTPARNYEETFYGGTPELDGLGQPSVRVKAVLSVGQEMVYGVRANDEPFRDMYKGLAMLASTDVSQITDTAAYEAWMGEVIDSLTAGQQGVTGISANIGFNQQIVETAQTRLTDISLIQRTQIADYENVDPYEAVTRMNNLQTQLEASYQVSSRLSSLTFLNYLR